jgi:hypothetical protein
MVSLYDQLISEISSLNPQLSPKEVSSYINILIENEILPAVVTRVRLPRLPSPVSVKHEELMAPRYGKLVRTPLQEKVRFIQDLEKFRVMFDGSDMTYEDISAGLMDNTQTLIVQQERVVEPNGKALPGEPDMIQEPLKTSPFVERLEEIAEKPSRFIGFDSTVSEKISSNPQFERVIGEIESRIRRKYSHEPLKMYFTFSIRTDIEDQDKEKTIIRINLPDSSFDKKMEFWDKIEAEIRDVIRQLSISEPERKKINRNTFTHIEPT